MYIIIIIAFLFLKKYRILLWCLAGLKLLDSSNPPASALKELGLQACTSVCILQAGPWGEVSALPVSGIGSKSKPQINEVKKNHK